MCRVISFDSRDTQRKANNLMQRLQGHVEMEQDILLEREGGKKVRERER
jgi:hypothetical protein